MSIAGYLSAGRPVELRMPTEIVDESGTSFDGAVLTGETTVDEQLRGDAVRAKMSTDEYYDGVDDYDPVLRAHCRL